MTRRRESEGEPDDRLMARYADGDAGAFRELYRRWEAPIYGFCLRYLGDPDAAADAFQEAFRRVVDAAGAYEPRGRFRSWLFTLARRACLDQVRERARDERLDPLEEAAGSRVRAITSTEDTILSRQEAERRLAALPREQREVLLLSKYLLFTYREIAEMMGSTEAAVKQSAYRALHALRAPNPATEFHPEG